MEFRRIRTQVCKWISSLLLLASKLLIHTARNAYLRVECYGYRLLFVYYYVPYAKVPQYTFERSKYYHGEFTMESSIAIFYKRYYLRIAVEQGESRIVVE